MDDVANSRAGSVTLEDVAREAGVSLATASRVLNGSTRTVAESYRKRVDAAAAKLGYTANLSAQATARGTSAVIALLVADIADPYFGELAAGVARGADNAGMVVTIAITDRDPGRELRLVRTLRGLRPRGVILAASRTAREDNAELSRQLDLVRVAGGRAVALGTGPELARIVRVDNRGGAHDLAVELGRLGYRDAVVLAAAEGVVTSDQRLDGFIEGFTSTGGSSPRVYRGEFSRESGTELMTRALADGITEGTVVFGISDVVAIGAISAIRALDREVGTDIAVCGFDDIPASRDVTPALTTVRVPLEQLGCDAFLAATEAEWHQNHEASRVAVHIRESTPTRP